MKLKKCLYCNIYTLKENCPKCKRKTKEAHYKFVKIKNSEQNRESFPHLTIS